MDQAEDAGEGAREAVAPADKARLIGKVALVVTLVSTVGNFVAAALARWLRYRRAIAKFSTYQS